MTTNNLLRGEVARLQAALDEIRNCTDARCSLCGRCLQAVNVPRALPDPPAIPDDDPIRTFRENLKENGNRPPC